MKAKVHLVGHLSGDEKWGAIYNCDAFILPSHQENFGIAVAEALACCKPVLITNKVNIYREIEQISAGIISDDNLEGMLEVIKMWLNLSPNCKLEMGKNAYNLYQNHFDVKIAAKRLVEKIKY